MFRVKRISFFGVYDLIRNTNWFAMSQKMARSFKYSIQEEERLFYLYCENKGTDHPCSDLRLQFAYAKQSVYHGVAEIVYEQDIFESVTES